MDPLAILQQFAFVPVVVIPVAFVLFGAVLWLMIVDRFLPGPTVVKTPALIVEEPEKVLVLTAVPLHARPATSGYDQQGRPTT